jgi:hypothetical protein
MVVGVTGPGTVSQLLEGAPRRVVEKLPEVILMCSLLRNHRATGCWMGVGWGGVEGEGAWPASHHKRAGLWLSLPRPEPSSS